MLKIFCYALIFSICYTLLRYVFFGGVDIIHIPVFLLNKAISMFSVITLLIASFYSYKHYPVKDVIFWGKTSFHTACAHILLSLALLNEHYFSKFFELGKFNLKGELVIFSGLLAIYCFFLLSNKKQKLFVKIKHVKIMSALFVIIHLIVMGFSGWLTVYKWHGGLPPISLVSLVFAIGSLILFSITKPRT